jgi:hypothetical protein
VARDAENTLEGEDFCPPTVCHFIVEALVIHLLPDGGPASYL